MKVMVIGPTEADSFADNVASTLTSMGIETIAAGPARSGPIARRGGRVVTMLASSSARLDGALQRQVVARARATRPDLVINLHGILRPRTVQDLKRHSGKVVLWFPDHVGNLGRLEMFLAGYDRMYFKNPILVRQLKLVTGLPAAYLPEAANPLWHRPAGAYGERRTFVVAGNLYPTRTLLLEHLLRDGIPLEIYGVGLPKWIHSPLVSAAFKGSYLTRRDKAEVFRTARGVINNLHPAEFAGSNCRLFEATASGAAVLTEPREGMADLFDISSELVTFETYDELLQRCNRLLGDPREGECVGNAASARTLREHTYERRLRSMFDDLGYSQDVA